MREAGAPSGLVNSSSRRSMCFEASIWRARWRSSAAFRRLTRPISRRYIRTGSSIISDDSMLSCHAACASASASSRCPASTSASDGSLESPWDAAAGFIAPPSSSDIRLLSGEPSTPKIWPDPPPARSRSKSDHRHVAWDVRYPCSDLQVLSRADCELGQAIIRPFQRCGFSRPPALKLSISLALSIAIESLTSWS